MKFFKKKLAWVVLIFFVGGGWFAYQRFTRSDAPRETVVAARTVITKTIDVTGTVVAVQSADLAFETGGTVRAFHVKVGDSVRKGQVLAELDRRVLNAQYQEALTALEIAKRDLTLARREWEDLKPEEREAEKLNVAEADAHAQAIAQNISKTFLRAPFDGTVTAIVPAAHEAIAALSTVVTVVGAGGFEIEALTPESDIAQLHIGQTASVTFDAFSSSDVFPATLTTIEPQSTVVQDVVFYKTVFTIAPDVQQRLKVGMTADLDVETAKKENVLAVPFRALLKEGGKTYAEVKRGDVFEKVVVTTGLEGDEGTVEIVSGLTDGAEITILTTKQP